MRLVGHGYICAADCDYGHGNDGAHGDDVSARAHRSGRRKGDQHPPAVGDISTRADPVDLLRTAVRRQRPDVGLR